MSNGRTGTIEEQTRKERTLGERLRTINGPSWGRTSDQPGRVDNRCATSARFQLPPPNRACTFQCTRLSRDTVFLRIPLYPFPVYRTLLRSFEYYGYSVAMHLLTFRRSPSSLTHHVCT